jgi:enamine deaminase RidA (YjgF/YER057c/UK114 family)
MAVSLHDPDGLHPPLGRYSHVAEATGTRTIYVAGQVGVDGDGALVGEGDVAAQTRQTYENLGLALTGAGATWADVVKLTTFLVAEDLIADFARVRDEVFERVFAGGACPPSTLLIVRGLARPDLLVEIEAVAVTG